MLEFILIFAVLAADQISKELVDENLALGESAPLVGGIVQLTSVHNTGAAWGILPNARWLFLIATPVLCLLIALLLIRRRRRIGPLGRVCLSLLLAGAVGNYIDRALLGYVRDMFELCFMRFPVFNVADSAITVGAALLCADTLFVKRGAVFSALEREASAPDGTPDAPAPAPDGTPDAPAPAPDGTADAPAGQPPAPDADPAAGEGTAADAPPSGDHA